jgi:hypothetical protein
MSSIRFAIVALSALLAGPISAAGNAVPDHAAAALAPKLSCNAQKAERSVVRGTDRCDAPPPRAIMQRSTPTPSTT